MRLIRREGNSEHGRVINDVLQYESVPDEDDSSPATMENLLINAMRQSPHWIGPGELRTPGEFATAPKSSTNWPLFLYNITCRGRQRSNISIFDSIPYGF